MMTEEEKLLFQRQSGRLSQAETWLAILIAHYGQDVMGGNQIVMTEVQAQQARARLINHRVPSVSIDYDLQSGIYTLDAL